MKIEEKNGGFWSEMAVLRDGEAEKTKRQARDARETEKF